MPSPQVGRQPQRTSATKSARARMSPARATRVDTVARGKMKRLGTILRRLRQERGLSTYQLAEVTGLHRSRITYLESGVPSEIGLEKFARLVAALGVSSEQVLREAGFLPAKSTDLAARKAVLAEHFALSPRDVEEALNFLEFLSAHAQRTKTPRSRPGKEKQR